MSLTNHSVQTAGERLLLAIDHHLASREIEVQGRLWRASPGMTIDGKKAATSWDWLYLALEAASDLLGAVYPITVRQLLEMILNNAPTEGAGVAVLARARRLLKVKWTHLLELDCNTVADLLRVVVTGLREDQKKENDNTEEWIQRASRAENKLFERGQKQHRAEIKLLDEVMDKRIPPRFLFQGKKYVFSDKQGWLLYILTHDEDGNKRDEDEGQYDGDVIWRLWGKRVARKTLAKVKRSERGIAKTLRVRLHTLQNATNAALDKKGLPLEIKRVRNNYLKLLPKPRRKR